MRFFSNSIDKFLADKIHQNPANKKIVKSSGASEISVAPGIKDKRLHWIIAPPDLPSLPPITSAAALPLLLSSSSSGIYDISFVATTEFDIGKWRNWVQGSTESLPHSTKS